MCGASWRRSLGCAKYPDTSSAAALDPSDRSAAGLVLLCSMLLMKVSDTQSTAWRF